MEQTRRYTFEGVTLDIPLYFDERTGIYIEDFPDFAERPVWTPRGHPVMFTGEDACPYAEAAAPPRCRDCGACRHYRPAGANALIGVCGHEARRRDPTAT